MSAWSYLQKLADLPHRGSASPAEASAARLIATELQQLGFVVDRQFFRAPRKTLYYGPSIVMGIILFATLRLAPEWPTMAFVLMALSIMPLLGELLGWPLNLDAFLPKHRSLNVVAYQDNSSKPTGPTIYVVAHYDTQLGSWLFAPFFRPYIQVFFTTCYVALALLPLLVALRAFLPNAPVVGELLWGCAIVLTLAFIWLVANGISGRYINGANDNGSGTALALALAQRVAAGEFPGVNMTFVFTGSEETGSRGMSHFLAHLQGITPDDAVFINLDNLGAGNPHYLEGEGMLGYTPYSERLVALAQQISNTQAGRVTPQRNLLLPTDGVLAQRAGYSAITFIATDIKGHIPHYHWFTDTIDNVDKELLGYMECYLTAYVQALAGHDQDQLQLKG